MRATASSSRHNGTQWMEHDSKFKTVFFTCRFFLLFRFPCNFVLFAALYYFCVEFFFHSIFVSKVTKKKKKKAQKCWNLNSPSTNKTTPFQNMLRTRWTSCFSLPWLMLSILRGLTRISTIISAILSHFRSFFLFRNCHHFFRHFILLRRRLLFCKKSRILSLWKGINCCLWINSLWLSIDPDVFSSMLCCFFSLQSSSSSF